MSDSTELTAQESRVVRLAAGSHSNEQIADVLGLSMDELVEEFRRLLWKLQLRPVAPPYPETPPRRLQGCGK